MEIIQYGNYEPLDISKNCQEFETLYKKMEKIVAKIKKLEKMDLLHPDFEVPNYIMTDHEIARNRTKRKKFIDILYIYEIRTALKIHDILWIPNDVEILEKMKIDFKHYETGPDHNRSTGYEIQFGDLPVFFVGDIGRHSLNRR